MKDDLIGRTPGQPFPADARDAPARKAYEKPTVSFIDLTVGEVLATGCKTVSGGYAATTSPCSAGSCSGVGS
ncbi:hypothetical protein [Syntrophobacter fumaroxidans]|uniref:hypothetical protein n=1 Tax=Syntrophobacter fumaroxidans TaxID=119484 RepID=UPI0002F71573|nr:hypothetical protein [Syntrophobacter fumaroxidans]